MELICCALDEDDEPCGQVARWLLLYGEYPDDYLYACETHRGPLELLDGGAIIVWPLEDVTWNP